jgi:CRP/FNR family transcriptional regulator, cyclic AMP receptor protein
MGDTGRCWSGAAPDRLLSRLLGENPLFSCMTADAHSQLIKQAAFYFLDPWENLFVVGDPGDRVFGILAGALQIEYPKPGKKRGRAVAFVKQHSLIGEAQVLQDRPYGVTGVAVTPLVAIGLTKKQLEGLFLAHPRFGWVVYHQVTQRSLSMTTNWQESLTRTPTEDLARYLLARLRIQGDDLKSRADLAVTQAELGQATGMRRETVNRVLRGWSERRGLLVVEPSRLIRIQVKKLKELIAHLGAADMIEV